MVALKHSCVIVEDGQLASCVAQEAVGAAWVVHIMHSSSYQGSHLVNGIQTLLLGQMKNVAIANWKGCCKINKDRLVIRGAVWKG